MAVITLENRSKGSAICRADIEAGLQTPAVRRATIKPGASVSYYALYAMNLASEARRPRFITRVAARMDAF